ncbi:adenosylmethionine--8-amino-7-oxononanoate transaminase [Candidatus Laterigemmans baculatus]|uniref:adenosylmethionine--8-amino-7-oxononanoate transaminase n=1 Tax=Candidatus Laterigemmans baculatus TaxID=2770505 RepID=UPI0013DAD862|nr:adenosylmethionine--8-amino-7-oxononanoate transaminase [Candidatus Laterigemmans baculatus]
MLQEERLETDLERLDRTAVWHGFTQMAHYNPMVIERGEGNWLVDCHGRRYLDAISSLWCNVHGHAHERINAAIREQLDRVAHVTSLGMGSATAAELAGRLVEIAPPGLEHVFFSSDGSSAVEAALKMAFQYWRQIANPEPQRSRFLALGSAYHGDTTGGVSLGGVEHFHRLFAPILFDPLRGPCPDAYRRPEGMDVDQACQFYLDQMQRLLEQHPGEIVAVVMEPLVQGAAGLIMHPPGFLAGVRRLTREHDVLLICDEVATGFGRTGRMFACENEDVAPDILCLGKGLTGGYLPMAATLASDQIWQAFLGEPSENRQFFHGHTFGGNPLAAAAALASLDLFESERTLERLPAKIEQLAAELAPLAEHPHVGDVRQRGLMIAIELVQDRATRQRFERAEMRGRKVCQRATDEGVWIRPLGDVIVLMPPLSILESEIELLGRTVREAIADEFAGM